MSQSVCVLITDGTNCHEETAHAFKVAGGLPQYVHVNELRDSPKRLLDFGILVIPGGFSYGDDIAAGRVLANELVTRLQDSLRSFIEVGRLILGICNGFQVLVSTGLLPGGRIGLPQAALTANDSGKFECRWVQLCFEHDSPCVFARGLTGQVLHLPVAHGEGKFVSRDVEALIQKSLAPLRYYDYGRPATRYPMNPNGSAHGIAGVCDPSGRIFGLMPHPERFVQREQHPDFETFKGGEPSGLAIFRNALAAAKE